MRSNMVRMGTAGGVTTPDLGDVSLVAGIVSSLKTGPREPTLGVDSTATPDSSIQWSQRIPRASSGLEPPQSGQVARLSASAIILATLSLRPGPAGVGRGKGFLDSGRGRDTST